MKYLLALILILLSFGCLAAVYMKTDSQGNVTYSDTADDHGQPITIPKAENQISVQNQNPSAPSQNNASASTPSNPETATGQAQTAHKNYTTFLIVSPTDQQTFQNQRDIPVMIKIDPPLQTGDTVQLYVDGIPAGDPSTDLSQLTVHQVDRGQHQITAALLDQANHVLSKTDNITVFIHYSAIPTGSGAVSPTSAGGNGVTPSSPGSGIAPPASAGSGTAPPASAGSGVTPPPQAPAQPGAGIVPPAQFGGGIVPGRP